MLFAYKYEYNINHLLLHIILDFLLTIPLSSVAIQKETVLHSHLFEVMQPEMEKII